MTSRRRLKRRKISPALTEQNILDVLRDCAVKFPFQAFSTALPPVILQHQLYSLMKESSKIDVVVERLRTKGKIMKFKYNSASNEWFLLQTTEFMGYIHLYFDGHDEFAPVLDSFLSLIEDLSHNVIISTTALVKHGLGSTQTRALLVKSGVLARRDEGSYWLQIPGLGSFCRDLEQGRAYLLQKLKRSKNREMLWKDLEQLEIKTSVCRIPIGFVLHDMTGSNTVQSRDTSSGRLIRLHHDDDNN